MKYSRITSIGHGGFGEVWSVKRESDGEIFAAKWARADLDDDLKARFVREVRIISSLDHPNIVKILARRLDKPPLWYVMPLYRHSLDSELTALVGDELRIQTVMAGVLDGVEYAHGQGVIHRDLNPRNVLMNDDGDVVIADFGLGRLIDSETTRKTLTGDQMGTPLYEAPEQTSDVKDTDDRCDIYSLGRMIYAMFTGPLRSLHQDLSQVPPMMARIIVRCTQHDRTKRFESVSDLKKAWNAYFDNAAREVGAGDLQALFAEAVTAGTLPAADARRLAELLSQENRGGADFVQDIVMKLTPALISDMWRENPGAMEHVLDEFLTIVASQSWGFSYTDRIADHVKALFGRIQDAELRATMISAVMQLGLHHNRWHVIEIFAELMYLPKTHEERTALVLALGEVPDRTRREAAEALNATKVPPELWAILNE